MSFINEQTKEINYKIVYFGPARSGKSTSLRHIYTTVSDGKGKDLLSLSGEKDRTLFFDFIPVSLGTVKGYKIRLHLYTVPGEVAYEASRKIIAKGVDGVVFVADSQLTMMDQNLASLSDLERILKLEGIALESTPHAIQYNKRDMKSIAPVTELDTVLNPYKAPYFETTATLGDGVMEALRDIGSQVLSKKT